MDDLLKDKRALTATSSPNFGFQVQFKKIDLAEDPLLWPYLEVHVYDELKAKPFNFGAGCEACFTTISLLDFADGLVSNFDQLNYCKA